MNLIIRHFALISAVIVGLNALFASRRVGVWFPDDVPAQAEARRFVWRAAACLGLLFLALEYFTVASGADSPLCFLPTRGASTTVGYIAWGLWIAWAAGIMSWIMIGQGAERVARYAPLFSGNARPGAHYNPRIIRLIALLWGVVTLAYPFTVPMNDSAAMACGQPGTATHAVSRGEP